MEKWTLKQTVMYSQLTVIHSVIKDTFINKDNLCANMDIHMNSFELCLMDTLMTTDKLHQYVMLLYCAYSDIPEHWKWFQYKTLILCNYGHSRTLTTVPAWNIDELCTYEYSRTLYQYRTLINCVEYWTLYQYAAFIFTDTDDQCHYGTPMNYAVMDMFINIMQFCDCGYS